MFFTEVFKILYTENYFVIAENFDIPGGDNQFQFPRKLL